MFAVNVVAIFKLMVEVVQLNVKFVRITMLGLKLKIITGDSRVKMSNSVADFKASCEVLSSKFSKIDRRSRSIDNLRQNWIKNKGNKYRCNFEVWLPCCQLGVPCSSRIMVAFASIDGQKCKSLIVACAEVKYCLLSTR
jgi:hypothetical protein